MSTLSTSKLLQAAMDSFKKQFPALFMFATDFSSDAHVFNQQLIARVNKLPTVQDYDSTDGYKANATNANALTEDVPVTMDCHKHVPIKIDFIEAASTNRNLYDEAVKDLAYSLGKEAFDYLLSTATTTNFSESSTFAVSDSDKDMTSAIAKALNKQGAGTRGRIGIVNSDVAEVLANDARVASRDYHGQLNGENAYKEFTSIDGFSRIYEYPDMPENGANVTGLFGTSQMAVIASRVPTKIRDMIGNALVDKIANVTTLRDPASGLTMVGIEWVEAGTFDAYVTVAWMYGIGTGSQGALPSAINSGTPTAGEWYKIATNGGSGDFIASGAPSNAVGTIFVANGTAPGAWTGSSLQLISQKTNQAGHLLVSA